MKRILLLILALLFSLNLAGCGFVEETQNNEEPGDNTPPVVSEEEHERIELVYEEKFVKDDLVDSVVDVLSINDRNQLFSEEGNGFYRTSIQNYLLYRELTQDIDVVGFEEVISEEQLTQTITIGNGNILSFIFYETSRDGVQKSTLTIDGNIDYDIYFSEVGEEILGIFDAGGSSINFVLGNYSLYEVEKGETITTVSYNFADSIFTNGDDVYQFENETEEGIPASVLFAHHDGNDISTFELLFATNQSEDTVIVKNSTEVLYTTLKDDFPELGGFLVSLDDLDFSEEYYFFDGIVGKDDYLYILNFETEFLNIRNSSTLTKTEKIAALGQMHDNYRAIEDELIYVADPQTSKEWAYKAVNFIRNILNKEMILIQQGGDYTNADFITYSESSISPLNGFKVSMYFENIEIDNYPLFESVKNYYINRYSSFSEYNKEFLSYDTLSVEKKSIVDNYHSLLLELSIETNYLFDDYDTKVEIETALDRNLTPEEMDVLLVYYNLHYAEMSADKYLATGDDKTDLTLLYLIHFESNFIDFLNVEGISTVEDVPAAVEQAVLDASLTNLTATEKESITNAVLLLVNYTMENGEVTIICENEEDPFWCYTKVDDLITEVNYIYFDIVEELIISWGLDAEIEERYLGISNRLQSIIETKVVSEQYPEFLAEFDSTTTIEEFKDVQEVHMHYSIWTEEEVVAFEDWFLMVDEIS